MADELMGKVFGSYKLVAPLGQGGMASVYRAYQATIDRTVAIKVMPAELLHDPNFLKRFINEARTLAKLQHPNILPLYDFGEANGMPYIIMPLMSGGTLADRLQRGPMPPAEVIRVIGPVTDALDYAHNQGLLHRDIKPNNILFDARDVPVIADFGIAKHIESASSLTGTGIIGTPDYMSPEQARGEHLDRRSDIYSLAVVVYQMLTGQQLFQATTPMSVIFKHVSEPPRPLRQLHPGLSADVDAVVMKSLAKNPPERHQTATEFARALAEAVQGSARTSSASPAPTVRPPAPATTAPARQGGVNMWLILGGVALLLVVCAFAVLGLGGLGALGLGTLVATEEAATAAAVAAQATRQSADATSTAVTLALLSEPIHLGRNWPIVYADDFSASSKNWPTGDLSGARAQGEQQIVDGVYFWNITAVDSLHLRSDLEGTSAVGDFYLSTDVRQVAGPDTADYGLIFRKSSGKSYYYFAVRESGSYGLYALENSSWTTLIDLTPSDAIGAGQFNRLTIVGQDAHFTFYINDTQVAAYDDQRFPSGTVGVAADLNVDERGKFEYDNFELRAP